MSCSRVRARLACCWLVGLVLIPYALSDVRVSACHSFDQEKKAVYGMRPRTGTMHPVVARLTLNRTDPTACVQQQQQQQQWRHPNEALAPPTAASSGSYMPPTPAQATDHEPRTLAFSSSDTLTESDAAGSFSIASLDY